MKICTLFVYFGPWPATVDLFLRSVTTNPDIDFLFVTDNAQSGFSSVNVRWLKTFWPAVRDRAVDALGVPVALARPDDLLLSRSPLHSARAA